MRNAGVTQGLSRAVLALVSLSACSQGQSVVGGDGGLTDTVTDMGVDVPVSLDVPVMIDVADVGVDVSIGIDRFDSGPTQCHSASDCASDPGGGACDTVSGRCVPCTPTDDRCPVGQYCSTGFACLSGCGDDSDCARSASDAGLADGGTIGSHCDTMSRQCVACVTNEHCTLGNLCVGGACVVGCSSAHGCPTGQTCCDGACLDLQSNTTACGACGTRCTVANGVAGCMNATCAVVSCTLPFADCDSDASNGCETDTNTTVSHCGSCGVSCQSRPNARVECVSGGCATTCESGFADCDGDAANGCETDTRNDVSHCGACGTMCSLPGATAGCASGRCAVATCGAGFADCDGLAVNGCEVNTQTDVAHCGACGSACAARPNAVAACGAGACIYACAAGFADCDGEPSNGCEVDVRTNAASCGSCGRRCDAAGGAAVCVAGVCTLTRCDSGRADCNGRVEDGCEVNTQTDVMHCGVCGHGCTGAAGAAASCAGGVCGYVCDGAHGDCDGMSANGCETNVQTTVGHCGACGRACSVAGGTGSCVGGMCTVGRCNDGYGDCDGSVANGCETNLETTEAHCGACGRGCGAGQGCYAGRCSVMCADEAVIPGPRAGCVNVAVGGTASASSMWTAGSAPAFAIDGNRCTGWNAGGYAVAYLQVDLGRVISVRGVTLVPFMSPTPAGVTHVVEVSSDGATFTPTLTISQTMASSGTYGYDFGRDVSARYVRVRTLSSPSWVAWGEVAVFRCE